MRVREWFLKAFFNSMNAPYGSSRMTAIVLRGTLFVTVSLTLLLIISLISVQTLDFTRAIAGITVIVYLLFGELLIYKKKFLSAAWMLIALFSLIAVAVLLSWSLNNSMGILAIGFIIFLTGTLLGTKYILPVTISIIALMCIVQLIHSSGVISPDLSELSKSSRFIDVLAYATVFSIFGLISWLSGKQNEKSIRRAKRAEDRIKLEKDSLAQKLEEQSITLRQTQLNEMASLYKFAAIGQSTTATLHELSNQLSILSLDINDLEVRHHQSQAILNAKEGIENINLLVRETRKQLQDGRDNIQFNALTVIDTTIKEISPKFKNKNVRIYKKYSPRTSFKMLGDPSNLSHVVTIILNNAFDACVNNENAEVKINVSQTNKELKLVIDDNGVGLSEFELKKLFSPQKTTKSNGLGIGLYIAKNIVTAQFLGTISASSLPAGMRFTITLPRYEKSPTLEVKTLH